MSGSTSGSMSSTRFTICFKASWYVSILPSYTSGGKHCFNPSMIASGSLPSFMFVLFSLSVCCFLATVFAAVFATGFAVSSVLSNCTVGKLLMLKSTL